MSGDLGDSFGNTSTVIDHVLQLQSNLLEIVLPLVGFQPLRHLRHVEHTSTELNSVGCTTREVDALHPTYAFANADNRQQFFLRRLFRDVKDRFTIRITGRNV